MYCKFWCLHELGAGNSNAPLWYPTASTSRKKISWTDTSFLPKYHQPLVSVLRNRASREACCEEYPPFKGAHCLAPHHHSSDFSEGVSLESSGKYRNFESSSIYCKIYCTNFWLEREITCGALRCSCLQLKVWLMPSARPHVAERSET